MIWCELCNDRIDLENNNPLFQFKSRPKDKQIVVVVEDSNISNLDNIDTDDYDNKADKSNLFNAVSANIILK